MMKKIFLIASLLLLTPVFAANWQEFSPKMYMDTNSISPYINEYGRQEPHVYSYWEKWLNDKSAYFTGIEKEYNKKVWYTITRTLINCSQKTSAIKAANYYDLNGNSIANFEFPIFSSSWNSIVPDSIGELKYEMICR